MRQQCYANCHYLKLLRGSELNIRCDNMDHRPWRETFRATSFQTKQKERQTKPHRRQLGSCNTTESPCIKVHTCKLKVICTRSCLHGTDSVRRAEQLRQLETHNTDTRHHEVNHLTAVRICLLNRLHRKKTKNKKNPSAMSLIVG